MGDPTPTFKANVLSNIYDADDAFKQLASHHEKVMGEEGRVQDLKKQLDQATKRLDSRRKEFDWVRDKALEFCPALETGYGTTPLTETVGIKDGRITVIPIEEVKRSRPDSDYPAETG